jgi:hypothetical protein
VRASSGNFQCPLHMLLAFNVSKIVRIHRMLLEELLQIHDGRLENKPFTEEINDLGQIFYAQHIKVLNHRRLCAIGAGQD